jgi:hypothetical protein
VSYQLPITPNQFSKSTLHNRSSIIQKSVKNTQFYSTCWPDPIRLPCSINKNDWTWENQIEPSGANKSAKKQKQSRTSERAKWEENANEAKNEGGLKLSRSEPSCEDKKSLEESVHFWKCFVLEVLCFSEQRKM